MKNSEIRIQNSVKAAALACALTCILSLNSEFRILNSAQAATPIVTDSRIKTFVYNENEVFNIVTHYGYQSNIELGPSESVQTLSIGDRVGWQIIPSGRRIFIRAMEEGAHTNMTVVTNKRAYQFDIREAGRAALMSGEQLVYVVRFYYPDEPGFQPPQPVVSAAAMMPPPAPVASAPLMSAPAAAQAVPAPAPMNYNYTFSGPAVIAPTKIYDDGRATYFKFPAAGAQPQVAVITASGAEMPVPSRVTPEGMTVVGVVAPRFLLKSGSSRVVVYNENAPGA